MDHFGYDTSDFIPCEKCGLRSSEIHHLIPRSLNKKLENDITNLCAVCRPCHDKAGRSKAFNEELKRIHQNTLSLFHVKKV